MTTPTTPKTTRSRTPKTPTPKQVAEADNAKQDAKQAPKDKTATDYRREIDLAIITAAGELVAKVPAKLRPEVAQLIANQLHHLSTPKAGWPAKNLPKPARSDWR